MRKFLSRTAAAAAVLLVALPVAASAAVDEYAAEASTSAVKISVFEDAVGSPLLDLVNTDAFAASDPTASAMVGAIEVLGEEMVPVVEATSEGEPARDPAEGDGCVELADASGLTLDAVCAVAAADAGDATTTSAHATTQLLTAAVDGSLLSTVLTTSLRDAISTQLIEEVDTAALTTAIEDLITQCDAVIEGVDSEAGLTQTAGDLLAMSPEELDTLAQQVSDTIGDADTNGVCSTLFDLSAEDLTALVDVSAIAAALEGVPLVTVEVDGASSTITGGDASLDVAAQQVTLRLGGAEDLSALTAAIETAVSGAIEELETLIPDLEVIDVQAVLDEVPLSDVTGPLITGEISGGAATAALATDDTSTSSGGTEPVVTVTIAPGLVELLGGEPEMATLELAAGESSGPIAEGTPLESSISVGALSTSDDAEFEDTGLRGSTADVSATTVSLLTGVEGGIVVELAASAAGVYGSAVTAAETPEPEEEDPLPHTGGGAAFAAALALGAALVLRRRRD